MKRTRLIYYNAINPKFLQTIGNIVVYNILQIYIDHSKINVRTNFVKRGLSEYLAKLIFGGVKFDRFFKILVKIFKGSCGHIAKNKFKGWKKGCIEIS